MKSMLSIRAAVILAAVVATGARAADCEVTFGAAFTGSYTCNDLGTPSGLPGSLGGLTFLNNNTLLIGGNANTSGGVIRSIDVLRDSGGHIIGFNGTSSAYATAPNIDGGLSFAPNGTLLATGFSNNTFLQYLPGSTAPDRITTLDDFGVESSVGALAIVPTGFSGAGRLKVASYSTGDFYDLAFTIDSNGLYTLGSATVTVLSDRGPEGIVYVDGANMGFSADSVLISDYGEGTISAYTIDVDGNPIAGSRQDFLSGLSGAEGAVIDPLTGDFLFSTFGSGNSVFVVSGFAVPQAVPEPGTWALMLVGFGAIGSAVRRQRVVTRVG